MIVIYSSIRLLILCCRYSEILDYHNVDSANSEAATAPASSAPEQADPEGQTA